jgi:ribose/xylose/arabinose/galactoside ABC-type transport system permease subunit
LVIAFAVLSMVNQYFLSWENVSNIISSSCTIILVGIGVGMTLLIRGTDLSVGSIIYLSAVVAWKITQTAPETPLIYLLLVSALVGLAVGLINGLVVASLKIYALLPTLATMYIARGAGLWIAGVSQGAVVSSYSVIINEKFLGLPYYVYIVFALAVIAQVFLTKTRLGRHIYATGDNEKMALEKGVKVFGIKVFVFAMAGLMSGLAATLFTATSNNVGYVMGQGFEFRVITACVLGGMSLNGGRGTVFPGVVVGALIWRLLYNALVLLKANQYSYDVVCAIAIFVVVLLDTIKTNKLEAK